VIARLTAAFLAASAIIGSVAAPVAIYGFQAYDPKFRDAPSSALQLALLDLALLSLIGALVFCVVCLFLRRHIAAISRATTIAIASGAVYPLAPYLLMSVLDPEASVTLAVAIAYVLGFPALAASLVRWPKTIMLMPSNSALVTDTCVAALRAFFSAAQRGR
jgi:hypothetical protein